MGGKGVIKYNISKEELQLLFNERLTREDISYLKDIPIDSLKYYIRKWSPIEFHRCRYCGTEDNLIIQHQKGEAITTNSCKKCSYEDRGRKISEGYKNRTEETKRIQSENKKASLAKRTKEDKLLSTEKRKKTCLERYGFENPMQCSEFVFTYLWNKNFRRSF